MQRLGVLLVMLLLAWQGYAQQAPQYTQYIFNELIINPAYAGSKEILNVNATHRSQWVGMEGAPTTQTFSLDGATRSGRIGFGLNAMNDELGAQRQLGLHGNLAVRLQMSETARLGLGFAAGLAQYTLDGTKLNTGNSRPDLAVPQNRVSELLPDFRIGAFFNTERFYTGLSVANLINTKGDELEVTTPNRHFFLSAGYVLDLSPSIIFKPSFLIKEDFNSPTGLDLNTFFLLGERIWLGGSYRTAVQVHNKYSDEYELDRRNAWAAIAQLYLTPKLRLGYSYDVSLNALKQHPSHEVSIGYSFFKKEDARMLTPRYF
ncbi:type IX secretion system membrane protein PorP/SprF [Pontibacter sp. JH31]|uniref:Type IX secretion system membrane protein PorP/SprF n=1 Tax=Pontibacter aquaedesilientis TaxID=2766980 RepID=A0ABR7XGA8_9BACT|nr:type IX secretion system membrane protein PorP/SprF [Pontibacter aquaedesilientis]MBD1397334.1 type IX secretion system membrane protein PorP/SprF [Pontibacter aquaedesilientis]